MPLVRGDLERLIETAAARYGVPHEFVRAIAAQESGVGGDEDPNIIVQKVSKKGALGPMQLMPSTAQGLGVDPTDPIQNIDGGTRLLATLLQTFGGNMEKAAAAYHAGPSAVLRATAPDGLPDTSDGDKSTRDYARDIVARTKGFVLTGPAEVVGGGDIPDFSHLSPSVREALGAGLSEALKAGVPPEDLTRFLNKNKDAITTAGQELLLNRLPLAVRAPSAIGEFVAELTEPSVTNILAAPLSFGGPGLARRALGAAGIKRLAVRFMSSPGKVSEIMATAANRTELAAMGKQVLSIVEEPNFLSKMAQGFGVALPFSLGEAVDALSDDDDRTPQGAFTSTLGFFMGIELVLASGGLVGRAISRRMGMRAARSLENELSADLKRRLAEEEALLAGIERTPGTALVPAGPLRDLTPEQMANPNFKLVGRPGAPSMPGAGGRQLVPSPSQRRALARRGVPPTEPEVIDITAKVVRDEVAPLSVVSRSVREAVEGMDSAEREIVAGAVEGAQAQGLIDPASPVQRELAEAVLDGAGRPVAQPLPAAAPVPGARAGRPEPGAALIAQAATGEAVVPAARRAVTAATEGEAAVIAHIDEVASANLALRREGATRDIASRTTEVAALEQDLKAAGGAEAAKPIATQLAHAKRDLADRTKALDNLEVSSTSLPKISTTFSKLPQAVQDRLEAQAPSSHIGRVVIPRSAKPGETYVIAGQVIIKHGRGRGKPTLSAQSEIVALSKNEADELVVHSHTTGTFDGTGPGERAGVPAYTLTNDAHPNPEQVVAMWEAEKLKAFYHQINDRIPSTTLSLDFTDTAIRDAFRRSRQGAGKRAQRGVRVIHGKRVATKGKGSEVTGDLEGIEASLTTPGSAAARARPQEDVMIEKEASANLAIIDDAAEAAEAARIWNSHAADSATATLLETVAPPPPPTAFASAREAAESLASAHKVISTSKRAEMLDPAQDRWMTAFDDLKTHAGNRGLLVDFIYPSNNIGQGDAILNLVRADTKEVVLQSASPLDIGDAIDAFRQAAATEPRLPSGGRVGQFPKDGCS